MKLYQMIVVAFAAFACMGAAPVEKAAPAQVQVVQPVEVIDITPTGGLYKACNEGDIERSSDLCAQWRAADAAAFNANITLWALVVSTIINVGTLIYLGLNFEQGKASYKAAIRSLEVQRAWIFPVEFTSTYTGAQIDDYGDITEHVVTAEIILENVSTAPALKIEVYGAIHFGQLSSIPEFEPNTLKVKKSSLISKERHPVFMSISEHEVLRVAQGDTDCFVLLRVTYSDVIGEKPRHFKGYFRLDVDEEAGRYFTKIYPVGDADIA